MILCSKWDVSLDFQLYRHAVFHSNHWQIMFIISITIDILLYQMLRKVIDLAGPRLRKYGRTAETYKSLAEIISYNESRLNESLQLMDRLVSIAPDLYIGHYLRANYLKRLDRIEEAKFALKKALKLEPNKAGLRLKAGELYAEMNETYKAEKNFRAGLALEPHNGDLMLQLGILLVDSTSSSVDDLGYAGNLYVALGYYIIIIIVGLI